MTSFTKGLGLGIVATLLLLVAIALIVILTLLWQISVEGSVLGIPQR